VMGPWDLAPLMRAASLCAVLMVDIVSYSGLVVARGVWEIGGVGL